MHKVEFKEEAKREQKFGGKVVPRKKHTVVFWDSPDRLPYSPSKATSSEHSYVPTDV